MATEKSPVSNPRRGGRGSGHARPACVARATSADGHMTSGRSPPLPWSQCYIKGSVGFSKYFLGGDSLLGTQNCVSPTPALGASWGGGEVVGTRAEATVWPEVSPGSSGPAEGWPPGVLCGGGARHRCPTASVSTVGLHGGPAPRKGPLHSWGLGQAG